MRSDRLGEVLDEIDNICIGFSDEVAAYRDNGDKDRYSLALLARARLISVYNDLSNAIDLLKVMEDPR